MKKGLSVLLIAAALFGFYGGATNLNDVLACKDYFTAASGASDDMQRLEDGLNQLKDNEEAYLAGLDQIAEGEQTLADGEAQYAQGLADYAAAPGKLAAGEKALAEGKQSYKDLKTLINGLKKAQKHGTKIEKADEWWHDAFANALKPGRKEIISQLGSNASLIGMLAGDNSVGKYINDNASYPNFDKDVQKLIKDIPTASSKLKGYASTASAYATNADLAQAAKVLTDDSAAEAALVSNVSEQIGKDENTTKQLLSLPSEDAIAQALQVAGMDAQTAAGTAKVLFPYAQAYQNKIYTSVREAAREKVASQVEASELYQMKDMLSGLSAQFPAVADLIDAMDALVANTLPDAYYAQYITGFQSGLGTLATTLKGLAEQLDGGIADLKKWDTGFQTLYHAKDGKTSEDYPDDLASKSSGVPYAFKNMTTNSTIKKAIKKYDPSLMKVLNQYTGDRLANDSMEKFDKDIYYLGEKVIPRALKVLAKVKAQANKDLAAGKAQLAQGYADYAAAPGKLADAEQQLADGRKQLAEGKEQLAVYEDGEQQVRDGLATLVGTDAMGNIQSIVDRIGNDTDFDNGDNHLEIDEGLAAVQAGKGYASDLTEAVTAEIMGRAIATGLLLAGAVLAVLAAILSFLKKNKGAGVFAILAAVAGCAGAYLANSAGMTFSSVAGSAVGATPMVAAGILAAVAAVHAIAHFTAKKEA